MKTIIRTLWNSLLVVFLGTLLAGQARGQIFVANSGSGTIGEYDYNTGGTVNASLVSGLSFPWGIAVSGANLFVTNNTASTIGEYNATTGATVNASLVSGLNGPDGVAVFGAYLFVANNTGGTIGKYNAATGATVNASVISGLSSPTGIAVSATSGYLYVANNTTGTIGEYNATTGATMNASLVSGLNHPTGVAVGGGYLYVANSGTGTIGKYNATTGATVNASLVSGLSGPNGIAVAAANLFVANNTSGTIGEYNATTGVAVNPSPLVSGLNGPIGIAVVATPPQFNLKTYPLNSNASGSITVNEGLNKIYPSRDPNSNFDGEVNVIDGVTFATPKDVGVGVNVAVDNKTNRYWAATVYQGSVIVRDGTTDSVLKTVPIPGGVCPTQTNYDFFKSRVWVATQCGGGNDPVFAIDATTFAITAGPIGSNGIMGSIIANGANGRLYIYDGTPTPLSERVNPTTFVVTNNPFTGEVMAINALTNTIYAVDHSANNLQIINGAPDPEVKLVPDIPLSYTPSGMGINTALNYLYISNPAAKSIEVRNGSTGALITTFALSAYPGVTPGVTSIGSMAVDSVRGRIYALDSASSPPRLLVIEDLINATKPQCILSH